MIRLWPQFLYLAIILVGLGFSLARHGEAKTVYEDFWSSLIGAIILWTILYYGGFFNPLLGR